MPGMQWIYDNDFSAVMISNMLILVLTPFVYVAEMFNRRSKKNTTFFTIGSFEELL